MPHDTIGDVVHVLFGTLAHAWTRRRREFCEWIRVTNGSDASDDFGPRDSLDIFLKKSIGT